MMTGQEINYFYHHVNTQNKMLKKELDKEISKKENIKMENENVNQSEPIRKAKKADPIDVGGIMLPDIPMPDTDNVESDIINDECETAFKIAFVGCGQGGCVDGDTLLPTNNGVYKFKNLYAESLKEIRQGDIKFLAQDTAINISHKKITTKTMNPYTGEIVDGLISTVWKNGTKKDAYEVILENGNEMIISSTHPVFVYNPGKCGDNKKLIEKAASLLKQGDLVVTSGFNSFETTNQYQIVNGLTIDEETAWILGLFAGDGYHRNTSGHVVSFYVSNKNVVSYLVEKLKNKFDFNVKCNERPGCTEVIFNDTWFGIILDNIFNYSGKKCYEIDVPDIIFKSPNSVMNSFIGGLIDSDGTVNKDWFEVSVTTASYEMCRTLMTLLNLCGLKANYNKKTSKRKNERNTYKIYISSIDGQRDSIYKLVNFIKDEKKKNRILERLVSGQKSFVNSAISLTYDSIKKILERAGYNGDNSLYDDTKNRIRLDGWKKGEQRLSYKNFKLLLDELFETEEIKLLKNCFDKLSPIKKINKLKNRQYYDITVEPNNNYFSGICGLSLVHNSRLAESFWKIGYRKVCCINTTNQDLKKINIPDNNKLVMDIGEGGAGKNPENGTKAVKRYYEDVYDLMRRSWGKEFDRIIVLAGLGGGTGTGSVNTLINIAHDIAETFKLESGFAVKENTEINKSMPSNPTNYTNPAVGCLVSMPMTSEGQKVNANAIQALEELFNKVGKGGKLSARSISPLIIVDNERIQKIYPNLPVTKFWSVANSSISSLFHLFNNIATKESEFTTFDRADFADVLTGGVITLGATPIAKFDSPTDISQAIRDNLKKNILVSGADLSQAKKAACIFIAHPDVLDQIPQGYLEHGFDMLTRIMAEGSVVHRGIYQGNVVDRSGKPGLVVYTMISELGKPEERMTELYRYAGMKK